MDILLSWLQSGLSAIGPFLILLGLLIFVHELGHFLVAKWCGVRVEVFSLGFGKKILKHTRGDTTYCISAIPLGGYVKMYGDDPSATVPVEERDRAFLYKPVAQRIAIVLAGPLMNFFFAVPLFIAVGINGELVPGTLLGDIEAQTPAYLAGFRSGDKILTVDGNDVSYWHEVQSVIEASASRELVFTVARTDGGSPVATIKATPQLVPNENILTLDPMVAQIPGLSTSGRAAIVGISSKDSLAAKAGLQNLDIITSVNGQAVNSFRELEQILAMVATQDSLDLKVRSYAQEKQSDERSLTITGLQSHLMAQTKDQSLLSAVGIERPDLYLLKVKENSPAFKAGLKDGDKILSLNGKPVTQWNEVLQTVKDYKPEDGKIHFSVSREDTTLELDISPEMTGVMNRKQQEEQRFTVGIIPAILETAGLPVLFRVTHPLKAIKFGIDKTLEWTRAIAVSFVRIVTAQVSHKNIGGVITIGRVASQSFEIGVSAFLRMMAIISINLFLINLLPVPILDGGHLVFFTIEALRGAPLSMRKMEIAQQVGLILLISLMVLSLFNDITSIVSSPW